MSYTRRNILKIGALAFLWLALGGLGRYVVRLFRPAQVDENEEDAPPKRVEETRPEPTPREEPEENEDPEAGQGWMRPLGDTGAMVSLFGLGGGGIIARVARKDDAVALVKEALDLGVNFIDTAPTYGDRTSELHIGEAIRGRRREVFLATKTLDRTYDETMRLFEGSLESLQTSYVDLYLVHGIRDEEDARAALQPGGAVQALKELQQEGSVRFIGLSGHRDPAPLRFMLQREEFDCVLIPLNPAEVHFRSFKDDLLGFASDQGIGVVAMKVPAYGRLLGDTFSMPQLLRYAGSLPISTAIVGLASLEELRENVQVCRDLTPYTPREIAHLEKRAEPLQESANFFKTEW